mmetsp:Transcript_1000/g.2268  ORF Transcript_1000/g.2268 Transcript_1000/m.2268 type:complete len:81 (-) Transcript_1000:163-405(-)
MSREPTGKEWKLAGRLSDEEATKQCECGSCALAVFLLSEQMLYGVVVVLDSLTDAKSMHSHMCSMSPPILSSHNMLLFSY